MSTAQMYAVFANGATEGKEIEASSPEHAGRIYMSRYWPVTHPATSVRLDVWGKVSPPICHNIYNVRIQHSPKQ